MVESWIGGDRDSKEDTKPDWDLTMVFGVDGFSERGTRAVLRVAI